MDIPDPYRYKQKLIWNLYPRVLLFEGMLAVDLKILLLIFFFLIYMSSAQEGVTFCPGAIGKYSKSAELRDGLIATWNDHFMKRYD